MQKFIRNAIITSGLLILSSHPALASYHIYVMNNTHTAVGLSSNCGNFIADACRTTNPENTIGAYQRYQVFDINYNVDIKRGYYYTTHAYLKIQKDTVVDAQVTVRGDFVDSVITKVAYSINGHEHVLLNADNAKQKVLPGQLHKGVFTIHGQKYSLWASAQKDHHNVTDLTAQGIDSIYFVLDEKHPILKPSTDPQELGMITYNIKDFPFYIGVAVDLNKRSSRIDYLINSDYLKNTDVVLLEEAWDRDDRKKIIAGLKSIYPYSVDPVPNNDYTKPLNSGLLVLSRYPITKNHFIDYQDYQTLTNADKFSNKGALYIQVNKGGQPYNIIMTHTQAGGSEALSIRQEEFVLIKDHLIKELHLSKKQPLIIGGDLNTDYYYSHYKFLQKTLKLDDMGMKNSVYAEPKYSSDNLINLMSPDDIRDRGMIDYLSPVLGFKKPLSVQRQITPVRATDWEPMYESPKSGVTYHYGDIETSDHFMVQAIIRYKK